MAIRDRRGLEGMPLKLLIVSLLISLAAPVILSSMGNYQALTSESMALSAAERIRETITATYISGPGNQRTMDSPIGNIECTIEIGGDLNRTESMVIKVIHEGGIERIYLSDPAVRVTTSGGQPYQLTSGTDRLSFACLSDSISGTGAYVLVIT